MIYLYTSTLDLFVAGIDTPVKSKVKSLKRKAADNDDVLLYPVKVEKIDIN
jgi:hypothetical protein